MSTPTPPIPTAPSAPTATFKPRFGKRVLVFGEGGVGKTTLATKFAGRTLFIDLERTLFDLFDEPPESIVPSYPESWDALLAVLKDADTLGYTNVVLDSLTSLETMMWQYIATHCRKAKEGYGMVEFSEKPLPPLKDEKELGGGGADSAKFAMWSRYEAAMNYLAAHGVNVVNLCHDCEKEREDAASGTDVKHEPRLNDPRSGKNSIRKRAFEIHGEVWFIRWETAQKDDTHQTKTGKRIILGQPTEERAGDFDGVMSKSRRGFSVAYLDEFDINEVLGIKPTDGGNN